MKKRGLGTRRTNKEVTALSVMVSGSQAGYADYQGDHEPRLQPPAEVPDSMAHIWREAYRSGWMELAAEDVPHC